MTTLDDIVTPTTLTGSSGILVKVTNPESPFGGVVIEMPGEIPIQVSLIQPGPPGPVGPEGPAGPQGPAGEGSIVATTNILKGDGAGGAIDSGLAVANVVQKQPLYSTPTNINQIIACLQSAGLCV